MRIVIAEDAVLLREGLAGLLADAGHSVVGRCGDANTLVALVAEHEPDLVLTDIRMPPSYVDEGIRAAVAIRAHYPDIGIVVLSQHLERELAVDLIKRGAGFGYLLKDRVLDVPTFFDSLQRVASGGSALDPNVVASLFRSRDNPTGLNALSAREREVLAEMAEGRTNTAIAQSLWLTERTVESHVRNIFGKLDLPTTSHDHRRVLAVVTYLRP